jgi:hypothetical protein
VTKYALLYLEVPPQALSVICYNIDCPVPGLTGLESQNRCPFVSLVTDPQNEQSCFQKLTYLGPQRIHNQTWMPEWPNRYTLFLPLLFFFCHAWDHLNLREMISLHFKWTGLENRHLSLSSFLPTEAECLTNWVPSSVTSRIQNFSKFWSLYLKRPPWQNFSL